MKNVRNFSPFFLISIIFSLLFSKSIMQTLFLSFLAFFARLIVSIKKPYIIGVTGTVGKTTITTHIATYLSHEFWRENVMISPYHYNGEFWLPLSIIGAKTWWKNPLLWIYVFLQAIIRLFRSYPRYLILEYGIDHPWEMDFLISIARPDIAIITPIAPNHLEQFGTLDRYRNEKLILASWAKRLIAYEGLRQYIDRDAIYYSTGGMSDIDASHMHMSVDGVHATIHLRESDYSIHIPAFWAYQVENILPLYAVADILGLDPAHISIYGDEFAPEAGRSSILQWKWKSVIIDGSYNGWYESLCRGIDSVIPFSTTHRIFFLLGDMRELGEHAESLHARLGDYIHEHVSNVHDVEFFLVWPLMQKYLFPNISEKYSTTHSLSSQNIGHIISKRLSMKDTPPTILYVKWSQNTIFLEEAIKPCLAHAWDEKLLCRQSREWMKKKDIFFKKLSQK